MEIKDNKERALYALLKLGIEMECDKILDLSIAGLKGQGLEGLEDNKRAIEGKAFFDKMYIESHVDENQMELELTAK